MISEKKKLMRIYINISVSFFFPCDGRNAKQSTLGDNSQVEGAFNNPIK